MAKFNRVIQVTTENNPDGTVRHERGTITQKNPDGSEYTVLITNRPNFEELCGDLRERGGVPKDVTISRTGETHF